MTIECNLDLHAYRTKDECKNAVPIIKTRLANGARTITLDNLRQAIENGCSFTPGVMKGTKAQHWQSQQIVAADIDNDKIITFIDENGEKQNKVVRCDKPMTAEEILDTVRENGMQPVMLYESMSSAPDWQRFRILICLDEAITDPAEMKAMNAAFQGMFRENDDSCKNLDRLFFGTNDPQKMRFFDADAVTPATALRALLAKQNAPQDKQESSGETSAPRPAASGHAAQNTKYTRIGGALDMLTDKQQDDIDSFDLAGYIMRTTGCGWDRTQRFMHPCPICNRPGHMHFQVTGHLFHNYSENDAKLPGHQDGGTIIHYLMDKHGIDKGAAHQMFKYDIMGYDRKEWDEAMTAQGRMRHEAEAEERWNQIAASMRTNTDTAADNAENTDSAANANNADNGAGWMDAFLGSIQGEQYKPMPIGIQEIDDIIGGGFIRQQIGILGAAPGMGKTALAQMIADTMAKNGTRVLYFNFEMSAEQMLARSLARQIYTTTGHDYSTLDIMQGYAWTDTTRADVLEALAHYRQEIAPCLTYGDRNPDLEAIRSRMEAAAKDGSAPVIFIDYLQMVRVKDAKDEAQTIKRALEVLKDYAIKHNTFVFIITANNRDSNKSGDPGLESGRDTSNIEYSGDLHLSIGYTAMMRSKIDGREAPRNVDALKRGIAEGTYSAYWKNAATLKVNKARFAEANRSVDLYFDGKHSLYTIEKMQTTTTAAKPSAYKPLDGFDR